MAKSNASPFSGSYTGETLHFGAIRYRLTGSGIFNSTLFSLDSVVNYAAPNITMTSPSSIEPTILANFNQQRAYLEGSVTPIGYNFVISKIIIYVKPVATGLPG